MLADEPKTPPGVDPAHQPPWTHAGRDLDRILSLSDGIFAFAMTLLVLGLVLPMGFGQPGGPSAWKVISAPSFHSALYAYLLSFFVIARYWQAHHLLFNYIETYDRTLINLNTAVLLFIAMMPFFSSFLSANSDFVTVSAYAIIQIAEGGALYGVWRYASGQRRHLAKDVPQEWVEFLSRTTLVTPVVFACSIPIALVNPGFGELSWLSLFVVMVLLRKRGRESA